MGVSGAGSDPDTFSSDGVREIVEAMGSRFLAFWDVVGGAADGLLTLDWEPKESLAWVLPPRRRVVGILGVR